VKKFLIAVCLLVLFAIPAMAQEALDVPDTISQIPNLKQGVAYSVSDSEFDYLSTFDVIGWKKLKLELGYSASDKAVAVISYPILNLKNDFNVTLPILELIDCRIGIYGGIGNIGNKGDNEATWGASVTFIEVKF
jgi:hypothetical protein